MALFNSGLRTMTATEIYSAELSQLLNGTEENEGSFTAAQWSMRDFIYNEVKNNELLQEDSTLNAFYVANENAAIGLFSTVADAIQALDYTQAITFNNSVSAVNATEENQQSFNAIYLSHLDSISAYTSSDVSNLHLIANQCASEGGSAVYQSRNLLMAIENRVLYFIDSCEIETENKKSLLNQSAEEYSMRLYPNPNNGSMIIEYKIVQDGILEIRDVSGKLVGKYELNSSLKSISVNANELANGIYYVTLIVNTNKVKIDKLVIIK
jgi:hypothetical protein